MSGYQKNEDSGAIKIPGIFEILAMSGFGIVAVSTFMNFVPVFEKSWRAGAVGMPVMLACLAGCWLVLKRNYFACFFIAMFSAFFLVHEIIILYDARAIEMGRELGPDGWFRPVFHVFRDAFTVKYGAFFALVGVLTALSGTSAGWILEILHLNRIAAESTEVDNNSETETGKSEFPVEEWAEADLARNNSPIPEE